MARSPRTTVTTDTTTTDASDVTLTPVSLDTYNTAGTAPDGYVDGAYIAPAERWTVADDGSVNVSTDTDTLAEYPSVADAVVAIMGSGNTPESTVEALTALYGATPGKRAVSFRNAVSTGTFGIMATAPVTAMAIGAAYASGAFTRDVSAAAPRVAPVVRTLGDYREALVSRAATLYAALLDTVGTVARDVCADSGLTGEWLEITPGELARAASDVTAPESGWSDNAVARGVVRVLSAPLFGTVGSTGPKAAATPVPPALAAVLADDTATPDTDGWVSVAALTRADSAHGGGAIAAHINRACAWFDFVAGDGPAVKRPELIGGVEYRLGMTTDERKAASVAGQPLVTKAVRVTDRRALAAYVSADHTDVADDDSEPTDY